MMGMKDFSVKSAADFAMREVSSYSVGETRVFRETRENNGINETIDHERNWHESQNRCRREKDRT